MKPQSPADKERYVHGVFDTIAGVYDRMNVVLTLGLWRRWQERFMREVRALPGQAFLDVACGTGDLTLLLAQGVGPAGRVEGVDLSAQMLQIAAQKVGARGFSERIGLRQGNALALPYEDESFDGATIGFALRNVADIEGTLREMARVVRPGGLVASLEVSRPESYLVREAFLLYFYRIVPWVGRLAGKGAAPYAWLPESHRGFPGRRDLEHVFRRAGLADVRSIPLSFGAVAIHFGHRSAGQD